MKVRLSMGLCSGTGALGKILDQTAATILPNQPSAILRAKLKPYMMAANGKNKPAPRRMWVLILSKFIVVLSLRVSLMEFHCFCTQKLLPLESGRLIWKNRTFAI